MARERKKGRGETNTNTDDDDDKFNLPEEVLFQVILVRLPIKPLLRFKSVSKRWQSLLHSPSFVHSHRRYHCREYSPGKLVHTPYINLSPRPTTPSSFFANLIHLKHHVLPPEISTNNLELPYPTGQFNPISPCGGPWIRHIRVLGPLNNGIYCMVATLQQIQRNFLSRPIESVVTGEIAFCNPGTRDYKFTNPFPSEVIPHLTHLVQRPCEVHYGFGSVHKDGTPGEGIPHDYKVVIVMRWGSGFNSFTSFVYSRRRGTWRTLDGLALAGIAIRTQQDDDDVLYPEIEETWEICPQGFLNGSWHWMARKRDQKYTVLLFHMADEVFTFFRGPPGYIKYMRDDQMMNIKGSVSVLKDHLAAFYLTTSVSSCEDTIFDVWMMMEYGDEDSWTKIYTIKPTCTYLRQLVGITSSRRDDCIGGIQIEKIIYQGCNGELITCDGSSVVEKHGLFDDSSSIYWNTPGISAYSQTLAPVIISAEEDDDVVSNSG